MMGRAPSPRSSSTRSEPSQAGRAHPVPSRMMDLVQGIEALPLPVEATAVTIGFFDGVHQGHQAVIRRMVEAARSEEHTSELQSQSNLVCRLLLEKKKYMHSIVSATSTHS